MKTRLFLSFAAVVIGLALTSSPAAAQVQWNAVYNYDEGVQQTLAIHPSGLVLEFHRANFVSALFYKVGRLQGTTVNWGVSQPAPASGYWPNVVITEDGHVLFVWSTRESKQGSSLHYMVGKLDPYGSNRESIQWLTNGQAFDAGFNSSVAMNELGVIVEVHESATGGWGIFYRVGHFADLAGGDYNIIWDSGPSGINYDDGINPHIAINNQNQVVEVHQVPNEDLLHYHRGVVMSGSIIDFGGSQRYHDYAYQPSVALLDNGQVLEMHGQDKDGGVYALPGTLNPTNPDLINWSNVARPDDRIAKYPVVAIDGTRPGPRIAVGTWAVIEEPVGNGRLNYGVGTLWGGP
jgi:hypothetical protein